MWRSCIHGAQQKSLTRDHRCSSHVLTSLLPRVGKQQELVDPTLKTIPKFHVQSELHAFVNLFSTTMWRESRASVSRHRDKKRGWLIVSDTATELCTDCDHGCHRPATGLPSKKLSQFVGHFSRKRRRQETAAALPKLLLLSRLAASSKRVAVSSEMVIAGSKRAWTISRPYPAASLCAMGQKPTRTCQGLDSHGAQQRSMSSKPCDVVAVGNGGNGGFGNIPACWKAS